MSDEPRPVKPDLIGLIYDSVDDGSRWPAFLEAFARAIRAPRCALLIRDPEGDRFVVVRWHGWPDEDIRIYLDRYGPMDPMRLVAVRTPEGTVGADYEVCPRQEFEASATFREFYAPRDCIYALGGVILVTRAGQSAITAHRGVKGGPFGEEEKSVVRPLMPHLKRAASLHAELGSLRRQIATFTGHLERYPYAFLLVDAERHVLYSNAAARKILKARDGLAIGNGRLETLSPDTEAALSKAVDELGGGQSRALRRLEILRPSRRKPYRAVLMPIDDARPIIPLGFAVPAVSVIVIDPESPSSPDPEVLRELFSLTPAEARVCVRVVQGQNTAEIATETGTSAETVRTHLKRILSKTGTNRQGELISLVLNSTRFQT